MAEPFVANLFLTIRVLLVGGLLVVIPRITRKGLLFGNYIGEDTVDGDPARTLLRRWNGRCVVLMVVSLLVGLGTGVLVEDAVVGNLTGTMILLVGAAALYVRYYLRARALALPAAADNAAKAVAPLGHVGSKGVGLARFALAFCIVVSVALFVYAVANQRAMTGRLSVQVLLAPCVNLATTPFVALLALLSRTAKRSFRGGSGGRSFEAQEAFRAVFARTTSWMALLTCAFLALLSIQLVRIGLYEIDPLRSGLWVVVGVTGLVTLVTILGRLVRIIRVYGQGGALQENGTAATPLTNGLADNTHWRLGLFYVDRDDPSILVEERFGIGYGLNWGNPKARLIFAIQATLMVGLVAFLVVMVVAR